MSVTLTVEQGNHTAPSAPHYDVAVSDGAHGSVTVSPKSASKGSTVTVTVTPDKGYALETLSVTDKNGNALDLQNYAIANDVSGIESWVEILSAGSLDGFDLESKLGGNIYDANGDFYAIGIENGVAVFRWAESLEEGGYALQVGFAQVPEPAVAAAILGALALGLAARRRVG